MLVTVELFTRSQVLNGRINCPDSCRLLDLFNGTYGKCDFIEFVPFSDAIVHGGIYQDKPKEYIRKAAIEFATVGEFDLARGCGANKNWKSYPVVQKMPAAVNLQMQNYALSGSIHLRLGQNIQSVLNGDMQFLPLTEVTIFTENHLYGTRPFVIVNKEYIFSSEEVLPEVVDAESSIVV